MFQVIQKNIWEYTQSILDDNPFESNEDHAFYGLMVDYIFEKYLELEESSEEIEKIINIYLKYTYQKADQHEEIVYNNLAINTFNYMIETDDTLRVQIEVFRIYCTFAKRNCLRIRSSNKKS